MFDRFLYLLSLLGKHRKNKEKRKELCAQFVTMICRLTVVSDRSIHDQQKKHDDVEEKVNRSKTRIPQEEKRKRRATLTNIFIN